MNPIDTIKKKIEGILFLYGEPLSVKKLSTLIGSDQSAIENALQALSTDYKERGIRLISKDNEWQLVTAPDLAMLLEDLAKAEYSENLSRAALEALAIVAYKGPLTRAEIEFIRGVNSVYSLRNLLMRGLIEKKENPRDGRSHLYAISFDFLRHIGIAGIEYMPRYEEFHIAPVPTPEEPLPGEESATHT